MPHLATFISFSNVIARLCLHHPVHGAGVLTHIHKTNLTVIIYCQPVLLFYKLCYSLCLRTKTNNTFICLQYRAKGSSAGAVAPSNPPPDHPGNPARTAQRKMQRRRSRRTDERPANVENTSETISNRFFFAK